MAGRSGGFFRVECRGRLSVRYGAAFNSRCIRDPGFIRAHGSYRRRVSATPFRRQKREPCRDRSRHRRRRRHRQLAAIVCAHIVDCVDVAINVEDGDQLRIHFDLCVVTLGMELRERRGSSHEATSSLSADAPLPTSWSDSRWIEYKFNVGTCNRRHHFDFLLHIPTSTSPMPQPGAVSVI